MNNSGDSQRTPVARNVELDPFNYEREPTKMVRCRTADSLTKLGIVVGNKSETNPGSFQGRFVTLHFNTCIQACS